MTSRRSYQVFISFINSDFLLFFLEGWVAPSCADARPQFTSWKLKRTKGKKSVPVVE